MKRTYCFITCSSKCYIILTEVRNYKFAFSLKYGTI